MTQTLDELTPEVVTDLDAAISDLAAGAGRWAHMSLPERAWLLERTHESVGRHAQAWTDAAMAAKGTPEWSAAEEWMGGPYAVLTWLPVAARTLRALAEGSSPADGLAVGRAPGGRVALKVMPSTRTDALLLSGFKAEVWMPPGVSADDVRARAGLGARSVGENNGVGLVLGAGNVSSIGPLDALYELIAFNRTSILKLNPTFASMLPVLRDALAPLYDAGVLRIVNGAAHIGSHLTSHPEISHVHITGSAVTHDAIVWGTGEEGQERRGAGTPLLSREISSELGGVSPVIVVPGEWSEADLRFQAEHVVTMKLNNVGHNCVAAQTLVLSSDWPQCEEFLGCVRDVLDELPARATWYPGSDRKQSMALESYPRAEDHQGRLLIDVADSDDLFSTEYFGPVLGFTTLPGTGSQFLRAAVQFANDRLDGTLGANVIVDPADRKGMGAAFDDAIADLRYGCIGVNCWSALGFAAPGVPWGAYPGNTIADVGSGIGVVHNAFLLDGAERTVVSGPFRPSPRSLARRELSFAPKPPWFLTSRTGPATVKKLTEFAGDGRWRRLPGIFASALRA